MVVVDHRLQDINIGYRRKDIRKGTDKPRRYFWMLALNREGEGPASLEKLPNVVE
jgi:hypothetical protein